MIPAFLDQSLFARACVHRSALNEQGVTESNERLEFLGDAVLELITTEYLYAQFPQEQEGVLTNYRAALVKTTTLAGVAKELGLDAAIRMSKGEERSGGRENVGLLADVFEAVCGALYLDQGYEAVKSFLTTHLFPKTQAMLAGELYKDYKTRLQELIQSKGQPTPLYETIQESGPDHLKVFTVAARVGEAVVGQGEGKNKQDASQAAAQDALEKMHVI